ncbi:MAG: tRNA(fMet)-specific endonuclease VapC [Candidatus Latescibacterota bacterium]|jgi:tRNA(fMet)-specific endonuclease VapC
MASSNLIIDTDIVIDFLRHQSNILPQAVTQYQCHLTAISLFELQMGAIRSEQQTQRFSEILQHFSVLPFNANAARQAATLARQLQQTGQMIGLPDTLIAGICLSQNIPLLTRNTRHYERVTGLQIITPNNLTLI